MEKLQLNRSEVVLVKAVEAARARSCFQVPRQLLDHSNEIVTKYCVPFLQGTFGQVLVNPPPAMSELQVSHLSGEAALTLEVVSE